MTCIGLTYDVRIFVIKVVSKTKLFSSIFINKDHNDNWISNIQIVWSEAF